MTEQVAGQVAEKSKSIRLASLDVFRGLTVAMMIFVNMVGLNNPAELDKKKLEALGIFKGFYSWIDHAPWNNSWHLADFAFPCFLYIVGMAMALSFAKYTTGNKPSREIYTKILRRAALLFLVGLLINGTVYALCDIPQKGIFDFGTVRITGVLQRIALTYAAASMIVLRFPTKVQWGIAAAILVGYFSLSFTHLPYAPIDPCPVTIQAATPAESAKKAAKIQEKNQKAYPGKGDTIPAFIDRKLVPVCHSYGKGAKVYDPEGLFSTLPAIVSVLFGYFNGAWLKTRRMIRSSNSSSMAMFGLGSVVVGILLGAASPINKNLWSSSFVLFMGGWALLTFALCYELIDVRGIGRKFTKPLEWLGLNPLFAFVGSVLMIKLIYFNNINGCAGKATDFEAVTVYDSLVKTLFGWAGAGHDTVLFAAATVLLWTFLCYLMHRMKWYIKL
jgi:predicted acyltransferase